MLILCAPPRSHRDPRIMRMLKATNCRLAIKTDAAKHVRQHKITIEALSIRR